MNDKLRLARAEAAAAMERDNLPETVRKNYEKACASSDAETAADYARRIRNRLLAESDEKVALDKNVPALPAGDDPAAICAWVREFIAVSTGPWAEYRQALRDLPEQEGFPFEITWPVRPDVSAEG